MRAGALLALLVPAVAAACRPSQPAPLDADAGAGPEDARPLSLNLDDAVVSDLLQALAVAGRKPIVVDPDAQEVARCARVTLFTGGPVPAESVIRLVGEALRPSGLLLEASDRGFIVRRAPGAPLPRACLPPSPPPTAEGATSAPADPPPPDNAAEDAAKTAKIAAGIRRIKDTEFHVTERARDLFFESTTTTMRSARIIPAMRDGRAIGMKLFGIRKGTVLDKLGFRNGDTLLSVAKMPVGSPDKALEAYTVVRSAPVIDVRLERKGREMDIQYKIVPK